MAETQEKILMINDKIICLAILIALSYRRDYFLTFCHLGCLSNIFVESVIIIITSNIKTSS